MLWNLRKLNRIERRNQRNSGVYLFVFFEIDELNFRKNFIIFSRWKNFIGQSWFRPVILNFFPCRIRTEIVLFLDIFAREKTTEKESLFLGWLDFGLVSLFFHLDEHRFDFSADLNTVRWQIREDRVEFVKDWVKCPR